MEKTKKLPILCKTCARNGCCRIQDRHPKMKGAIACVDYDKECLMSPECSCEDCQRENVKMD